MATQLTFKPWRVFINHVDSYHGKKLTDFLLSTLYVHPINLTKINSNMKDNTIDDDSLDEIEVDDPTLSIAAIKEQKTDNYEIIGTIRNSDYEVPKNVRIVDVDNRKILLNELMSCGYIIYDITLDDDQIELASWSVKAIAGELENALKSSGSLFDDTTKNVHYFMLISNIMTWAKTKSLDPENPNASFTEADYAKRQPHKNFIEHMNCENDVIMMEKCYNNLSSIFKTLVLCCGITYGEEQGPLNFLFKMAWDNSKSLPIFGDGTNKIPLLHVAELTNIVHSLFYCWPERVRYLVATELDLISQVTIVKKISGVFTNRPTKRLVDVTNDYIDITIKNYDIMTVDINIEPAYTLDKCIQSNVTFVLNFYKMIKEYRIFRNILPVNIVVVGPPAVGKTILSKRLAHYYCNSHINIKSLITQTIQSLTNAIERIECVNDVEVENNNVDFKNFDDEYYELDCSQDNIMENCILRQSQLLNQLNEIRNNLTKNNGQLDDDMLNKMLLKCLSSKKCNNRGYILDGYPKTFEQARELFGYSDGNNFVKNDNVNLILKGNSEHTNIMPEIIIVLEASDEFLLDRVINLPEREIQRAQYDVEYILGSLKQYRNQNEGDNANVLEYFIINKIPILIISIEDDCSEMYSSFKKCLNRIGKPRNLERLKLEAATMNAEIARDDVKTRATTRAIDLRKKKKIIVNQHEHDRMMIAWANQLEKIRQDEENTLQKLAEPLRLYLVDYVFPILTQGLIEVGRLRPNDPVDFLAEFIFRNNPYGKMFELEDSTEENLTSDG